MRQHAIMYTFGSQPAGHTRGGQVGVRSLGWRGRRLGSWRGIHGLGRWLGLVAGAGGEAAAAVWQGGFGCLGRRLAQVAWLAKGTMAVEH